MIDLTTQFGRKVKQHLRKEYVVWLTTVGADLSPQPRPVWFIWDKIPSSFSANHRLTKCGTLPRIRRCRSISTPMRPATRM